jgi:integrase/recombinase XerD
MDRLVLQFAAHLHLHRYSENSIQNHRLDLLRFQEWLAERGAASLPGVQALGREQLEAYQAVLALRLKPRSVARHLTTLRLFWGFLEQSGLVHGNPLELVAYPRFIPPLPAMLLPSEVGDLLAAPSEAHYLGLRDKAMLELLYSSGLKLHELIGLDTESLHLEMGFLKVRGRRERMVPVTSRAAALLSRYLEESRPGRVLRSDEPCLFPGRNGTRISRVGVWKAIRKYARQAGIEKPFNPRSLRHSFAGHLLLAGMDLDALKTLFGYRRLEATALYAHVNAPDFQATYRAYHPHAAPPHTEPQS